MIVFPRTFETRAIAFTAFSHEPDAKRMKAGSTSSTFAHAFRVSRSTSLKLYLARVVVVAGCVVVGGCVVVVDEVTVVGAIVELDVSSSAIRASSASTSSLLLELQLLRTTARATTIIIKKRAMDIRPHP
jgi:hypothetical protein